MKKEEIEQKVAGEVFISRHIVEASFGEWIEHIFNRAEGDIHWTLGDSELIWSLPKPVTAEYVARTFEEPGVWMKNYSVRQIAAGLEFTWNTSLGDVCSVFTDTEIPWEGRKRAIQALIPLYRHCFQALCNRGLSHLDESLDNRLNASCYMFWEVCSLYPRANDPTAREQDTECLRVMEQALQIDHDACRESALHGLGHWESDYSSRVHSIIEQSLKTVRKRLRAELLSYAKRAQAGWVQ